MMNDPAPNIDSAQDAECLHLGKESERSLNREMQSSTRSADSWGITPAAGLKDESLANITKSMKSLHSYSHLRVGRTCGVLMSHAPRCSCLSIHLSLEATPFMSAITRRGPLTPRFQGSLDQS